MVAAAALFLLGTAPAGAATFAEAKGDFDGDGRSDRAAIETGPAGWTLVATMGARRTVLETQPGTPDGFYLKPMPQGRYGGVRIRHAAFEFGREESGAQIIYWTGKRWARIQQGD